MATLTGCSNLLDDKPADAAIQQGFGTVRVSLTQGAARTAMPAVPTGLGYTYTFTRVGGAAVDKTPENGQFVLEAGSYTLTVKAFLAEGGTTSLAAQGTADFEISAGATVKTVPVTLSPIVSTGEGTLKYTLTFPTGTTVKTLTLTRLGDTETTIPHDGGVTSTQQYTVPVGAGYWLMQAVLERTADGAIAGMVEVAHIYANLDTVVAYTFADDEFHKPPAPGIYDPTGTWDFTISGQGATVTITGTSWVFDGYGTTYDDTGTFTLNGNVGTLYSDAWKANIGTGTLTSNTTMNLTLRSPSLITGTFNGTKRDGTTTTTSLDELEDYLATLPIGTAENPTTTKPLTLAFNTGETIPSGQIAWSAINTAVADSRKYVILDLSASTAANGTTANTIAGADYTPQGNYFNIIWDNTYIKGITLPSTLTSIGYNAFSGCSGLTSVTIPEGITSIGDYAFVECSGLTIVDIPGNVISIGDGAFAYCSDLTAFTVAASNPAYSAQGGILYDKDKTTIISVPPTKIGVIDLPNTVTSIGKLAFFGCSGLTSVTISDRVTSIGRGAFSGCSGLTGVLTIPGTVTSIGESVFEDCSALRSVTIEEGVISIGYLAFYRYSALISVTFGAGSNITTAWANNAFTDNNYDSTGDSLWTAYTTGGTKAGTYTRSGTTWTQTAP
jgi:hypothetical protein